MFIKKVITFYYQNAGGFRTRINDFALQVNACVYDVIIITETWLCDSLLQFTYTPFQECIVHYFLLYMHSDFAYTREDGRTCYLAYFVTFRTDILCP